MLSWERGHFGDKFAAVEAERANADPSPPDSDVAGLDVALADPGVRAGIVAAEHGALASSGQGSCVSGVITLRGIDCSSSSVYDTGQ